MSYWRWWLLATLSAVPFIFLMGYGAYHLWMSGWFFWVWWPLAACVMAAFLLAWHWQRKRQLISDRFEPSPQWTERDAEAFKIVEKRVANASAVPLDQLVRVSFYVETAEKLAIELAQFYHPGAKDPVSRLTVLEVLGVIELASHDLAIEIEKYVPGSHLLTLDAWRKAQTAIAWYDAAKNIGWMIAGFMNPISTGARYLATQFGMSKPWEKIQQDLQYWFYTAYVHRVGGYLIELYSGRLRLGALRHRELFSEEASTNGQADRPITLAIIGQTKAGKSSLVNALLGERRAETDVTTPTPEITRYDLNPGSLEAHLVILDTVGYAHLGPRQDQLRATEAAAREADLILLATHVRSPARQADLEMLQSLTNYFRAHPDLKKPPLIAVVTHVDLLSPSLEWAPPYDWLKPERPKERNMAGAVAVVQEQLGEHLLGVVPVCTAPGKVWGVEEGLLPALAAVLEQARAVTLVRCLRAEADKGKVKKMFHQLLSVGTEVVKRWWAAQKK